MKWRPLGAEECVKLRDGREACLKHTYLRKHELPPIALPLWELARAKRARWVCAVAETEVGTLLKASVAFTFPRSKTSLVVVSSNGEKWEKAYLSVRGNAAQGMREMRAALCPLIASGLIPEPVAVVRRNAYLNYALEEVRFECA